MTTTTTWSEVTRKAIFEACEAVRETPIGYGRTVWDLLKDERSRRAVIVTEKYLAGEATDEELSAAAWAASDAAADAADVALDETWAAAWAASYVASAVASGDADAAANAAAMAVSNAAYAAYAARMAMAGAEKRS